MLIPATVGCGSALAPLIPVFGPTVIRLISIAAWMRAIRLKLCLWQNKAFGCSQNGEPCLVPHKPACVRMSSPEQLQLACLLKRQRRFCARCCACGWGEGDHDAFQLLEGEIDALMQNARKTAIDDWKAKCCDLRFAAKWARPKTGPPGRLLRSDGSLAMSPAEQGAAIADEWLPRWTASDDALARQTEARGYAARAFRGVSNFPVDQVGWTPQEILHHCNNSAPGPDGWEFRHFKQMSQDHLDKLAQLYNAIDSGAPLPKEWHHARLVRIAKVDDLGATRPISILQIAYRLSEAHLRGGAACGCVP